jgi:hypothetical protein
MPGRPFPPLLVIVAVVLASAALAGCQADRSPRRVPDDGAACSAVMPGAPKTGPDRTFRLDSVVVIERTWTLAPLDAGATPKDLTTYVVRRATVPAGAPLQQMALLDAAAARVGRGVALQNETKPTVQRIVMSSGGFITLRWTTGKLHSATRLLLAPNGYCEVTVTFAPTDAAVDAYLDSAQGQARS